VADESNSSIDDQYQRALNRLRAELPWEAVAWLHHVQSASSRPDYRAGPPYRTVAPPTASWQVAVFLNGTEVGGEGDTADAAVDDVLGELGVAGQAASKPSKIASLGTAEWREESDEGRAAAS
jgi:hypothetical protein